MDRGHDRYRLAREVLRWVEQQGDTRAVEDRIDEITSTLGSLDLFLKHLEHIWTLEAEIRRLHCQRCDRIVTEAVPWARPRARHSRDFEDVVAWLAQRSDKTTISRLMRTSWETVAGIVTRVVAEQIDQQRLTGLLRIGVDEVSYRKGHRYLTVGGRP